MKSTLPAGGATGNGRHSARAQRILSVVSVAVLVACAMTLVRVLPVHEAVLRLREWVDGQGIRGAVVFAAAYVLAGLAFVPGSALTLAAGAVFGVAAGTALVSVASTVTAALAFLIARHLARERVAAWARRTPRFEAVDSAIGDQDWKVVLLLRLSPAIPFSLGNYLYGLTAARFVPYVLASWIGMLPGTLLYVVLGDAGATGLEATSGGGTGMRSGRTLLLVVGLVATIAVTVLIKRAAGKALARRSDLEPRPTDQEKPMDSETRPSGRLRRLLLPAGATAALLVTVATCSFRESLSGLFGPPQVEMKEVYAGDESDEVFDHSRFDALLRKGVDEHGGVDYEALANEPGELDAYVASLADAPFDELGRDEKLALLLNAYNAFTLRLILDYLPLDSIRDIPEEKRWDDPRWRLAGQDYSLNQIEHEEIRPKFAEPRIHFALVCAAVGCPPLRRDAYSGERLEEQLEEQAVFVHARDRWFQFDPERKLLRLTPLYDWYGGDFRQAAGSVEAFASGYSEPLRAALAAGEPIDVEFLDYDWSLNWQGAVR